MMILSCTSFVQHGLQENLQSPGFYHYCSLCHLSVSFIFKTPALSLQNSYFRSAYVISTISISFCKICLTFHTRMHITLITFRFSPMFLSVPLASFSSHGSYISPLSFLYLIRTSHHPDIIHGVCCFIRSLAVFFFITYNFIKLNPSSSVGLLCYLSCLF